MLERQNSLRPMTRKAQRKPLWRVSYHSWAPLIMSQSPYAKEWNFSCFPNIPGLFRPEPLHRMPLMLPDPPGSNGTLPLQPACVPAAVGGSFSGAPGSPVLQQTWCSVCSSVSYSLARGLSEGGVYWILVCSSVRQGGQHLPHRGTMRTQRDAHCPPSSG